MKAEKAIRNYEQQMSDVSDVQYLEMLRLAGEYNGSIPKRSYRYRLSEEELKTYESLLNVGGDGIMGYVSIPCIRVNLPIYHGTSDRVLQVGAGHVDWTYLPVGGPGTHSVISAHRGLPSAKLFTNLDKVQVGDTFTLTVLDEVLTYEVDQILTVLPENVEPLEPEEGMDLCTLETCTPLGINTHRLLVRGHRVSSADRPDEPRIISEAVQIEPFTILLLIGIPFLVLVWLLCLLLRRRKRS